MEETGLFSPFRETQDDDTRVRTIVKGTKRAQVVFHRRDRSSMARLDRTQIRLQCASPGQRETIERPRDEYKEYSIQGIEIKFPFEVYFKLRAYTRLCKLNVSVKKAYTSQLGLMNEVNMLGTMIFQERS